MARRTRRGRRATRLALEALETIETLSDDQDRSEGSQEGIQKVAENDDISRDSDYVVDKAGPIDDGEEEEEAEEVDDDSVDDEFQSTDESSSDESTSESAGELDMLQRRRQFVDNEEDDEEDSNQLLRDGDDDFHSVGKLERYASLFGQDIEGLAGALKGRDKWASNEIFPRREAKSGVGGFRESFLRSDEATEAEATEDWEWYYEGGGETRFERYQKLQELDEDTGREYVTPRSGPSVKVLMGPRAKQKLVTIDTREWRRIEDIWREAERESNTQPQHRKRKKRSPREGWLFNVGNLVQDITWMPVSRRTTQYLALSTVPFTEEPKSLRVEAYSRAGPSPACIQFWAIPSSTEPEREGRMDYTSAPRLSFVLCTDWGIIKQMKWCPAPRDGRDEPGGWALLAGIWGDGKMRLVKVAIPDEDEEEEEASTRYIKVEKVAFEYCPPDTICACVDWLSASHIAVGCANGFVAIWDLAEHISCPPHTTPRPYFYLPLHPTYILTILSCYPSHPDCILTSSLDGYVRLTIIDSPEADFVFAPRCRTGIAAVVWSDAIQSTFSPEDRNNIRCLAFRRFYTGFNLIRHPANVLSMAVGTTHTTLLAGGVDGTAMAFNPLRKLLFPRVNNRHITWFLHEYSPRNDGVSRFMEGFKSNRDPNPRFFKESLITTLTVYEAKSAVTHLVWNPNVLCGSWAVAAMADGIVRVEDLAVLRGLESRKLFPQSLQAASQSPEKCGARAIGRLSLLASASYQASQHSVQQAASRWPRLEARPIGATRQVTRCGLLGMYEVTKTGLGPRMVWFESEDVALQPTPGRASPLSSPTGDNKTGWKRKHYIIRPADAHNLQRPETVESLFLMYRITNEDIYREWGWKIFQAFLR
ncbi:MAG: hypothetical protein M1816_001529 [Peltula sp. TS41687]|nr:MAG: hypothetical protein M1816_001529 [Peltula sp. TS41687]